MKKIAVLSVIIGGGILLAGCNKSVEVQLPVQVLTGAQTTGTSTPQSTYTQDSWKTMVPASCKTFYDGCNECFRTGTGVDDVACTRKFCETYEMPSCKDLNPAQ